MVACGQGDTANVGINVLKTDDPCPDNMIGLQIDIAEFSFSPSINQQVLFVFLLSTHQHPTRRSNVISSCFPHDAHNHSRVGWAEITSSLLLQKRKVAHVPFTTGFSQGNSPGPGFSSSLYHSSAISKYSLRCQSLWHYG